MMLKESMVTNWECLDSSEEYFGTVYIWDSGHLEVGLNTFQKHLDTFSWCKTEKRSGRKSKQHRARSGLLVMVSVMDSDSGCDELQLVASAASLAWAPAWG